ncbi:anti-sigma factor [Amycolatopsis sp., V23-08]|uniref:Anti-sigma factor n=1 Tax=Amycolatopsis heterodermiae TaxID=3110235 RepID=A0ABU5RB52_9PSEU|nr:anti-sigma factor [Amycolatopsis sp., V23-08]MEA5363478.1 anti-sigma factor [Amycolatopsis sp., V23-08]
MSHPDPDRLVLLALDEQPPGPDDTAHLDRCADCREELESLRAVAGLGRETVTETSLPPVREAIWDRIATETGQAPRSPSAEGSGQVLPFHGPGGDRASDRRFSRRARYAVVAAVAAAIGVIGTLIAVDTGGQDDRVVAQAQLNRQASAPAGAAGVVRIVDTGTGTLRLRVQLTGMPAPTGLYEIWLFDGTKTMIPLGVTAGTEADVSVPPNLALSSYPVVDISAQELGQQEHGVSMLQGTLGT